MKKSMILFIAAAAAVMALVSCTKETPDNNGTKEEQNTGLRTLTVSFAPSTRTTLNGLQPVWQGGELISLNGTTNVTVPAEAAGKTSFTLTTAITGDIIAVYPADAWSSSESHFTLSKQDGTFAAANICTANAKAGDTELTFNNQTAVIELNVPDGTKSLTVTSLNPIGTSGQRESSGAEAIADGSSPTTISISNNSLSSPWYVAVLPGALLRDLNFDVTYSEGKTAQGGFSPYYIASKKLDPDKLTVEENSLYTLPDGSLHEYVTTVDSQKWATMNVGATEANPNGLYFAWGETTGIMPSGNTFTFPDTKYYSADNSTWDKSKGFYWANCPYTKGEYTGSDKNVFTKYIPSAKSDYWGGSGTVDNKTTLDLKDDAAFWNWGGAWRMPEKDDFETFISGASYTGGNFEHKGVTFPAAGYGSGSNVTGAGNGYYWSSSLSDDPSKASYFNFCYYSPSLIRKNTSDYNRYYGHSVRPFSE